MGFFQTAYDMIKAIKTPPWWKVFMAELQTIILQISIQVGQVYFDNLKSKIISVSEMDIPNEEKFMIVFKYGKDTMPSIKDSALRMLIEIIVNKLKYTRMI